ncbi:MAG: hemolysin family protein [Bryobacteraceae bacterium]
MTALLLLLAIALVVLLVVVTYVQHLYYESLRLRSRGSLEFFKSTLQARIGAEADRGVLTFSVIKHTALMSLGVVFLLLSPKWTAGSLAEAFVSAWLTMLAATYVAPHVLYRRSSGRWLRPLTPALRGLVILARPLVTLFGFFQTLTELTESTETAEEPPTPAENVEALITAGAEEGLIEESDRELIQSVVAFGDTTVREVMTPRPRMVAIAADQSLEDLRQLVINEQYSRIPVFEGSIDQIIGFVHVRDMFELEEEDRKQRTVRGLVRPIRFVPETKAVNDLLREMQDDRAHMAIVVDEYGNTAGLATMEDLMEEVFGEIQDEHEPERDVTQEANGDYVISGNFGVDRLEELVGFHPAEQPESTTVGGLLTEWLGRVPQPGESVAREGIKVEVLASNELRVEQVRVSRTEPASHA